MGLQDGAKNRLLLPIQAGISSLLHCGQQVHVKVAAAGAGFQGVQSVEEAMELIEYVGTCPSLELRGITADQHSSVEVCILS